MIYRANTNHPLYSILHDLVKKHLGLDELVESVVKRIGDVQKVVLIGDYAKGIDSGLIEVLLVAENVNNDYIIELQKKIKHKIGRRVNFSFESKEDGILLYDKQLMYYES